MVKVGDQAPEIELPNQDGKIVRLSDFRGRPVVLYFYPKDFTTGCTAEAKDFNEGFEELSSKGVVVLGVSADTVESHKKFKEKLGLKFNLLSDVERKAIKAYGAQAGARTRRMTFIIDKDGRVAYVFSKVTPVGHSKQVLEKLKELKLI